MLFYDFNNQRLNGLRHLPFITNPLTRKKSPKKLSDLMTNRLINDNYFVAFLVTDNFDEGRFLQCVGRFCK